MTRPLFPVVLLLNAGFALAQTTPPPAQVKIHEVGADGLRIDGTLTNGDPPLVFVPVAELKGSPHQVFQVKLLKGQPYVIELASDDFDSFLILQNAIGKVLGFDDDRGGGLNSRLAFAATSDGVYRLVVAALDRKHGAFQLKIRVGEVAADDKLAAEADALNNEARELYQRGQAAEAVVKARAALAIRRKLYPAAKYPDGHPDLATSFNNLGFLLKLMGSYEQALPYAEQALAMRRNLYPAAKYPDGHPDLAQGFNSLGTLFDSMGWYEKALPLSRQALAMRQTLYPVSKHPDGHPDVARSLNNLAALLESMGSYERALPYAEQALAMHRKLYPETKHPDGHPEFAISLNNLGSLLDSMGAYERALTYHEQALAMKRRLYPTLRFPKGHPDLAVSLNNLAVLLEAMGSHERALPYQEQALEMRQRLYPESKYADGHPELASSLNNLARLLAAMGFLDKALPYYQRGLEMAERLYPATRFPDGHPHLASSISNLGGLLGAMGSTTKALQHWEQSLAMRRRLYPESKFPDGHPDLASNLNNLGFLLYATGAYKEALPYFEQGLAMTRTLYPLSKFPEGHPRLASSLNNLGALLRTLGAKQKAMVYYEQALAMFQKLGGRLLATASEAEALAFAQAQPLTRDAFLSLTATMPDTAAAAYRAVWSSKSAVTRVLEQRQAAARAAGTEHAALLDEFKGLRRRIDQLLQDRRFPPGERDKLLSQLTDDRDALERTLAKALPTLRRAKEMSALDPTALGRWLPDDAALIDLVRYTRVEFDPAKPGNAGETRTPCYAAFLLTKAVAPLEVSIRRIELGEAGPMDLAVAQWRAAIDARTESPAAMELRDRLWSKLAPQLPIGTKTLYLAPDGDLARMPWAALPTGRQRVLLEDYMLATVPHGPFLLESLQYPRAYRGGATALFVGDLLYQSKAWPDLPGTAKELHVLSALAPAQQVNLAKSDATPAALAWALTKVRYAHVATHGYFDAETLIAEQQRARRAIELRAFGDETRRVAAKNPLAFCGLVLAGGDVFSGLNLVDLPLENLRLVTLSACETGLGETTGGEGVQGLHRAFHLAGCPNVVASLWKVNDAATAALMAKFYHELWVNQRTPIDALREAQLTIYRHPELIPDLAGERGAPRLKSAVAARTAEPSAPAAGRRTDTKLWAAFALSGLGK